MDIGKIYFITSPSPTLGRSTLHGIGGVFLGRHKEKEYIGVLRQGLKDYNLKWTVASDDTESNIEMIIARKIKLLVCAPGLRFQFYNHGFEKRNIIHLSMMDYVNNNIHPVISRIAAISHQDNVSL